jgi:hypothetical protein
MTAPTPSVPGAKVITAGSTDYVELISGGPLKQVALLSGISYRKEAPQILVPAGLSQATATAITSHNVIVNVVTTVSTHGLRLPVGVTGQEYTVANGALFGFKVWPPVNGKIGAAATNIADTTLAINKQNKYKAVNTTFWVVQRGA